LYKNAHLLHRTAFSFRALFIPLWGPVAPRIQPITFREDLVVGMGVRQTCFVVQGDPPLLVSWFKDGESLENSDESIRVTRIDPVTSMLAIGELTAAHAGNYSCVAKNDVAAVAVTAPLVVRGGYYYCHFLPRGPHDNGADSALKRLRYRTKLALCFIERKRVSAKALFH
jgi:hypothetical protein